MNSPLSDVLLFCKKGKAVDIEAHQPLSVAFQLFQTHNVSSLAVYGAPGHFYSSSDLSLSVHNDKQYIGLISLADCISHLVSSSKHSIQDSAFNVIGATNESMSLWILKSSASIGTCLEPFSKGLHACLVDSGPDQSLSFISQYDIVKFLHDRLTRGNVYESANASKTLEESFPFIASASNAVTASLSNTIPDALKIMSDWSRRSVGVVDKSGCLVDFFSLSDLKMLLAWTSEGGLLNAISALNDTTIESFLIASRGGVSKKSGVFLLPTSSLRDAAESALEGHVHHVWIVSHIAKLERRPVAVLSFSDLLAKLDELLA